MDSISVVVFAAGVGSRLGQLTADKPKALLELEHSGYTFLDHMLSTVYSCAGASVTVVGGYQIDRLRAHLDFAWGHRKEVGSIRVLDNPTYRVINNIGSAVLAADALQDGGFILNSDIVFDPEIFIRAHDTARHRPDQSFVVVDCRDGLGDEEMKVIVDEDGVVKRISKLLPVETSLGEFIGVMYLAADDARLFLRTAAAVLAAGGKDKYYEDALDSVINEIRLKVVPTDARAWTEVDTPDDYERAIKIYQALKAEV